MVDAREGRLVASPRLFSSPRTYTSAVIYKGSCAGPMGLVESFRWWGACESAGELGSSARAHRHIHRPTPTGAGARWGCAQALASHANGASILGPGAGGTTGAIVGWDGAEHEHDDPPLGADGQARALRAPRVPRRSRPQANSRRDPRQRGIVALGPRLRARRRPHRARQPRAGFLRAGARRPEPPPLAQRRSTFGSRPETRRLLRKAFQDLQAPQHGGRRREEHWTDLGRGEGRARHADRTPFAEEPPGRDAAALERASGRHEPRWAETRAPDVCGLPRAVAARVHNAMSGSAWNHRIGASEVPLRLLHRDRQPQAPVRSLLR